MSKENLSAEVTDFINRYISSLEELEILVLFSNSSAAEKSSEEVNNTIRSTLASVTARLKSLKDKGFLIEETSGKFRFKPVSDNLSEGCRQLSAAYKDRRVKVIEMIFTKPLSGIKEFAEAFKFKGEKNE